MVITADAPTGPFGGFTWAGPDVVVYAAGDGRLVAVPASGGPLRVLSADGEAAAPAATAAGDRVAFVLQRDDRCDIAVVPADGSAWPVRLSTGADWAFDPAWSPDGRALAWHEWDFPDMPWDASRIVVRPMEGSTGDGPPLVVAGGDGRLACGQPRFSPTGDALGFVSDGTGWMWSYGWLAMSSWQRSRGASDDPAGSPSPGRAVARRAVAHCAIARWQ